MDWTKKQKKSSRDFNAVLRKPVRIDEFYRPYNTNKLSLWKRFFKILSSIRFVIPSFPILFKRLKKFLYKRFFWGRGIYYRFSVLIAIIVMAIPATVLAANIKGDNTFVNNDANRVVDTALDTGTGKTSIPNTKTIESIESYVVQKGDTISSIAAAREISVDTLMYANSLNENSVLQVGQTLKILPFSGILYKVKSGDTLESIAKKYDIAKAGYSPQVMLEINLLDSTVLQANQEILVPGATIDKPSVTKAVVASSFRRTRAPITGAMFISPTGGLGNITTCFSSIHPAVDIDSLIGPVPLYASSGGTVIYAGYGESGGSGISVLIDHANGYKTDYLHMSRLYVSVGDHVDQGQQIGIMGATGRATGIHVHFIIKYNGINLNPFDYVDLSRYPREYTATSC